LHQALSPHGDAVERAAHDGQVLATSVGDDQSLPVAREQFHAKPELITDKCLGVPHPSW
jgi:hypothetical protein